MVTHLRWALTPVVSLLGWYLALVISMGLYALTQSLCPQEHLVSGLCSASWFSAASKAIICFGAGLAATLVVLFSALMAPAKKMQVAWFVFALGLVVAVCMTLQTGAFTELCTAVFFGLMTALALKNHFKHIA